jgi:hypothetical protein
MDKLKVNLLSLFPLSPNGTTPLAKKMMPGGSNAKPQWVKELTSGKCPCWVSAMAWAHNTKIFCQHVGQSPKQIA